jgi:hypothetical protein
VKTAVLLAAAAACATRPRQPRGPQADAHDLGQLVWQATIADEARPHLLRGLAALHSFEYAEAAAAFRRAQAGDSAAVLAYVGEALSFVYGLPGLNDTLAARSALARLGPTAGARAARARTAREARYLEAAEHLAGAGDRTARFAAFGRVMDAVAAAHPGDDEAALFAGRRC